MIGRKISHYRVLRILGQGGMGEVYLAQDERLGRKVAVKALPPEVAGDPIRRKRFDRESRVLASLNHPAIVTIHDIAETDEGPFLVMEWIDGAPLGSRIGFDGMSMDEVYDLFLPLVDAVAAAHREGIVHRDLKPDNVMVRADGLVKVVDFGLSKLEPQTLAGGLTLDATETLTREGAVVGTIHYMSPEALDGRAVDSRSDVFSLGVILYEMVTGEKPFRGESALSVITAILRDQPPSLSAIRQPLPGDLERIVARCLEKDPAKRYPSAAELARDLREARLKDTAEYAPPPPSRRRIRLTPMVVSLLVVAAGVTYWFWPRTPEAPLPEAQTLGSEPTRVTRQTEPAIAVLPLRGTEGEDAEGLGEGITEALTSHLARLAGIRILAAPSVRRVAKTGETPSEVAHALGARYLVDGHLAREDNLIVLSLSLLDPDTGSVLWGDTFRGTAGEVFAFLGRVVLDIGLKTGAEIEPGDVTGPTDSDSFSDRTSEEYLRGLRELAARDPASLQRALAHFQRAVQVDDTFAPGWAGVATSSALLASFGAGVVPPREYLATAREAAMRAIELRPDLADAHAALALARLQEWEAEGVETEFRRAIALNPSHSQARISYAGFLVAQGRFQEALVQAKTLCDLDPLNPLSHQVLASAHYFAGDYEAAITTADAGLERVGPFWLLQLTAGDALSLLGRYDEADIRLERARELSRDHVSILTAVALNASRRGDADKVEGVLTEILQRVAVGFVPPSLVAKVYFASGDREAGFDWLERGYRLRDPLMTYLAVDPDYRDLRDDPRFQDLVDRIGILR